MNAYLNKMAAKGLCPPRKPLSKIAWSWLGAFLGIFLLSWLSQTLPASGIGGTLLLGSFGATAVLLYGAPLAEFSQPRNLIGGHCFSAIVGVSVCLVFGESHSLAAPLAVSLSIALMHGTRTLHPPGGATALIAIIGGEPIQALGYLYVIFPVFLGAMIMLLVALLVNNLSENPKRHYPVYWL